MKNNILIYNASNAESIKIPSPLLKHCVSNGLERQLHAYLVLSHYTRDSAGYSSRSVMASRLIKSGMSRSSSYRMISSLISNGWIKNLGEKLKCVSKKIISQSINESKKYVTVTISDLRKGYKWTIGTAVAQVAYRLERYIQFTNRLQKGTVKWIAGVTLQSIAKNLSISISKAHRILGTGNFVRKQNFKNLYVIEKSMFSSHIKYNNLGFPFSIIQLKNSSKLLVRRRLGSSYYPL